MNLQTNVNLLAIVSRNLDRPQKTQAFFGTGRFPTMDSGGFLANGFAHLQFDFLPFTHLRFRNSPGLGPERVRSLEQLLLFLAQTIFSRSENHAQVGGCQGGPGQDQSPLFESEGSPFFETLLELFFLFFKI